jgi:hypothetical protein
VILSGSTVRSENVQLLAAMLDGGELATKLERALTNNNTIVALSIADRERIVAVVADGPAGFAELRRVLVTQLDKHHERETQVRHLKRESAVGANMEASGSAPTVTGSCSSPAFDSPSQDEGGPPPSTCPRIPLLAELGRPPRRPH